LNFPDDDTSDLQADLARLKQEHRDLDMAIEALERMVAGDQLQIQRLKKRKLGLKDRIIAIEDQPDRPIRQDRLDDHGLPAALELSRVHGVVGAGQRFLGRILGHQQGAPN
jgi:hypothetical protein